MTGGAYDLWKPTDEDAITHQEIVDLLKVHFPQANETDIENEAQSLDIRRSIATAMQSVDRRDRPSSKDLDAMIKVLHALRASEEQIRGLGLIGAKALAESARQMNTFDGDQFGVFLPTGEDPLHIFGDAIAELHTGLQQAIDTMDPADDTPSRKGRPPNVEASEFANTLCQCFERLSGNEVTLSTDNAAGKKSGPCLDFVKAAFKLFDVGGSEEDLVRAFSGGGKTQKKY